jgi:tetratricopeptide (TPR) repeat protein
MPFAPQSAQNRHTPAVLDRLSTKSNQPGNALRQPWLLFGGLLWGIGFTVGGIGLMVGDAGVQTANMIIGGLFFIGAIALTCIGLADKYVMHPGRAAVLRPRLRLFACIFGVTGLLGIVLPALIPAIYAARYVAEEIKVKGEFDKAIADYTEAIRLNPKDAKAYYLRGLFYKVRGKTDKAKADIAEAKRLGYSRK